MELSRDSSPGFDFQNGIEKSIALEHPRSIREKTVEIRIEILFLFPNIGNKQVAITGLSGHKHRWFRFMQDQASASFSNDMIEYQDDF